ncbi:MAG: DNA-directed DNA polymerase II small subunit [Thermoplasmata archaeon]|nr:DNA-directed DNA polymerase II small subunit [Thermoplasmata archaeon]
MNEKKQILELLWKNGIIATPSDVDKIIKNGGVSYALEMLTKKNNNEKNYEILKSRDVFDATAGKVESFKKLFQDRYSKIRKILQSRVSISSVVDIEYAKKSEGDVTIIGMILDKRESKFGYIFEIEDLSGSIVAFSDQNVGKEILPDDIIGIKGYVKNGKLTIKEITYPGIDNINKKERIVESENGIVFLSDIHVGSKMFMKENFLRFLDWINSGKDHAKKIKYMVIAGDLVDGIGIYPNQEKDLELDDIYDQYKYLANLISKIRGDITIFMIPGNHDLVRVAEPQPALGNDIRSMFTNNVIFLSNPSYISIEGLKILIYHGSSLNDVIDLIKGMKLEMADRLMIELVKRRHLAPFYGKNVPIVPLNDDFMVMDEIPDIFVTGHIHVHKEFNYYGILLLNASTWQKQTEYQKMHNFNPNPCIVSIKYLNKQGFVNLEFK